MDGTLWIEDVGSSNRTLVAGGPALEKGQRAALSEGGQLLLGDTRITVADSETRGVPDFDVAPTLTRPDDDSDEWEGDTQGRETKPIWNTSSSAVAAPPTSEDEAAAGRNARLIIVDESLRAVVAIDRAEFTFGRSRRRAPDHVLEHEGVSGRHARVVFEDGRFYLEDLGSTNGTFLGEEVLTQGERRALTCDAFVRFGPIDALFLVDDEHGRGPTDEHAIAIELLARAGKIGTTRRGKLLGPGTDTHPGEELITANQIGLRDWVAALQQAREGGPIEREEEPGGSRGVWWTLVGVGVMAVGVAAWLLS